jgi:hypothetical protein
LFQAIIQTCFILSHHLNGHYRWLIIVISYLPSYNSKLNFVFFTNINCLVECFCVEEMALKVDGD